MNLGLSLLATAERTPAAEALVDGHTRLDYAALQGRAARLAGGLAGLGVGRGDRVAAVLKNRHETVELFWACQWLGAWFVPLSWRVSPADVAYCVADAGARIVLVEPASEEHAAALADVRLVSVGGASGCALALDELRAADPHPGALDLDDGAISIMLYTSGTTGRPKGVPRSHRAERAGGLSQALQHGYLHGDRTLGVMPLYHTMGDHSMLAMSLISGCYVCQPDWSAERALELIERERVTSLYLAPTLFHDLVTHPGRPTRDLSSVRALGYAGAAMTGALVERCLEAFDPEVFVNHYGSTEIYTFSLDANQRAKPGCAGRPALNARLRLVRPEPGAGPDDLAPPGAEGEIACQLTSDEAFAGYWNRPDADAKAIRDGWYLTGDLGRLDEDGDLWIVGRVDDMIISGGENIHPLEVEDALARHPKVREVAVIGAPDDRWGQRVVACVVADAGTTPDELDAFLLDGGALARFKRPREYRLVEALPKSASGKILRRVLRDA
ncbi:MAG: AMP-binding protein [Thermoleophilia bacterium]